MMHASETMFRQLFSHFECIQSKEECTQFSKDSEGIFRI
mgnify:CR=1 FL=1